MKSFLPADEEIGFQMAPMIDCVFLLIIFFMSAANQRQAEKVKIEVPEAANATVAKDQSGRGTVTIMNDGKIYVGTIPSSLDDVARLVEAGLRENPSLRIFLRADSRVPYKSVREVMGRIAEGGVSDIIFATYEK